MGYPHAYYKWGLTGYTEGYILTVGKLVEIGVGVTIKRKAIWN